MTRKFRSEVAGWGWRYHFPSLRPPNFRFVQLYSREGGGNHRARRPTSGITTASPGSLARISRRKRCSFGVKDREYDIGVVHQPRREMHRFPDAVRSTKATAKNLHQSEVGPHADNRIVAISITTHENAVFRLAGRCQSATVAVHHRDQHILTSLRLRRHATPLAIRERHRGRLAARSAVASTATRTPPPRLAIGCRLHVH